MCSFQSLHTTSIVTTATIIVVVIVGLRAENFVDGVRVRNIRAGNLENPGGPRIVRPGSEPMPESIVPQDVTILSSESLPSNKNFLPEVGNGHIATIAQSNAIFMNGLYNGAGYNSHRARIPSTAGYFITATLPPTLMRSYTLDLGRGIFAERYESDTANITLRTYAHRLYRATLVTELVLSRRDDTSEVGVIISLNTGGASEDVDFTPIAHGFAQGVTKEAEYPDIANTTEFYIKVSPSLNGILRLSQNKQTETYLSLTVIEVRREVVEQEYDLVIKSFYEGTLLSSHVQEWNKVWASGRIDVEGDTTVAKLNYASLYYILSSLPFNGGSKDWPFFGLSPGGLARGGAEQDNNGHVFWDQDVWMFSPIALLYPDLGRLIVESRTRILKSAMKYAQMTGWRGARYPSETASTGYCDVLNDQPRLYFIKNVDHLSKSIVNASLRNRGAELHKDGIDHLVELASTNEVMPPDNWHSPVNDSVYTNYVAAINLEFANQLVERFSKTENSTWKDIQSKMYLPYDADRDFHPEFEGFHDSEEINQADAVMLGFPLMVSMSASTRMRDLNIYERLTPIDTTPVMTWAMYLLGWLELGNQTKAAELFARSVLNAQQPFLVWSQNANGSGATNFITGMGGYLQSILFGYGGIRLHEDTMTFNPNLIPRITKVKFTGINYRGCSFDLSYSTDLMTLSLTSIEPNFRSLDVLFQERENWEEMIVGQDIRMKRQSFTIRSSQ